MTRTTNRDQMAIKIVISVGQVFHAKEFLTSALNFPIRRPFLKLLKLIFFVLSLSVLAVCGNAAVAVSRRSSGVAWLLVELSSKVWYNNRLYIRIQYILMFYRTANGGGLLRPVQQHLPIRQAFWVQVHWSDYTSAVTCLLRHTASLQSKTIWTNFYRCAVLSLTPDSRRKVNLQMGSRRLNKQSRHSR